MAASESSGIVKVNVNMDEVHRSWFSNIEQNNFNQYFNEVWNTKVYHRRSKYLIIFFSSISKLSRLNVLKFYVLFLGSNFIILLNLNSFTFFRGYFLKLEQPLCRTGSFGDVRKIYTKSLKMSPIYSFSVKVQPAEISIPWSVRTFAKFKICHKNLHHRYCLSKLSNSTKY